ncbi:hypothetical protein Bca4012_061784 [Brassica carinata]
MAERDEERENQDVFCLSALTTFKSPASSTQFSHRTHTHTHTHTRYSLDLLCFHHPRFSAANSNIAQKTSSESKGKGGFSVSKRYWFMPIRPIGKQQNNR